MCVYIQSYAEKFKPQNFIVFLFVFAHRLYTFILSFTGIRFFVPWHYVSGCTHMPLLPWLTYPDQEPLWLCTLVQPYGVYRATFLLLHKWLL